MKKIGVFIVVVVFMLSLSGCIRTYVFEKERVDQEVTGNRGMIMGEIPTAAKAQMPPKRTVIGVDVEIPVLTEIKKKEPVKEREFTSDRELWGNQGYLFSREVTGEKPTYPYRAERVEEISVVERSVRRPSEKIEILPEIPEVPEEYSIEYTIKKGDTLSSIAANSNIYGDAGKWKRIYEANRDILKDSSHVYPGQVLTIPMGSEEEGVRGEGVK